MSHSLPSIPIIGPLTLLLRSRRQTFPEAVPAALLFCWLALALSAPLMGQEKPADREPADDVPAASFLNDVPRLEEEAPAPAPPPVHSPPPNIGGGVWLAQGPVPAIFGQVEAILPGPNEVVGAVHTVAAHPSDSDILYLGGVNGGVWKTTNATAASPFWTPLTDFEHSLSIGALEFDPTDVTNMTLVAGVGRYSSFGSFGGSRTGNLLKTTDGGATWSTLAGFIGATSPAGISGVAPRGMTIVASSNTSDLFFCVDVGIWRSVDGGTTFAKVSTGAGVPDGVAFDLASDSASATTLYTGITFGAVCTGGVLPNGIYKSTDTGLTWTKVSDAVMDALIIDGTTNNIEIAADGLDVYVDIIQSGRPAGIFHSGDGGSTWTAMDLPRTPEGAPTPIAPPGAVIPGAPISIDTSSSGPHGLSSGMEVEVMGVLGTLGANGVWTTTVTSTATFDLIGSVDFVAWVPGSGSWVKVVGLSPKEKPGSQGSIHASIRVDPVTGTTVYLGGDRQDFPFPNFIGALNFSGRLFRGDSSVAATGAIPSPQWEHLTHAIGPPTAGGGTLSKSSPHADSREMVFDANGELIEGDDGGIYRRTSPTSDGGDWFSINGNLQVTEQHDVAYDAVSDVIISGNQDTGTTQQQTAGGNLTWDSVSTADGGDVAVDDLSVAGVSTRYSSFQFLGAFRRREHDTSNVLLTTVFPTLIPMGMVTPIANFVTPVELNAIVPTSLLIGGCNAVFESFDKGDTIIEIPGLFSAVCSPPVMGFPQNAMAYGGFSGGMPDPDAIWVGSGSAVFNRLMAPGSPLVVTLGPFPGGTVTDIVLDPTDTSTAYVVDATDVYQTHDGGITWTPLSGNLTDTRLGTAAIDPGPPGRLFVGGREGVFELALPAPGVAAVGPFVWGELGTGLPNAPVWDLEWDTTVGVLLAGTLGRGAWTLQGNGTCGFPKDLVVRNQQVTATTTFKACNNIVGGPALTVNGTVDFEAGLTVGFGPGTSLSGTVSVKIDPSLISP